MSRVQIILGSSFFLFFFFVKGALSSWRDSQLQEVLLKKTQTLCLSSPLSCAYFQGRKYRHFYYLFQPYCNFFTGLRKTNCHLHAWFWPRMIRLCSALRISIFLAHMYLQGDISCSKSPWKALAPSSVRGRRTREKVRMAEKPLPGTSSFSCIEW